MIPLHKVFMPDGIEESIGKVLHSGELAYGEPALKFEKSVRKFIGNPHFLASNSFNSAMMIALHLAGVEAEDEVISSPMSCLASNQPIAVRQARIVWADIDPETGTLDPDDVARKITPKTRAIVHFHWAGCPGYIDEINHIAKEAGIRVIEDASESFGAKYKERRIGNTSTDMVCFSFQTVRLPNTIDGGGIAFGSEELFERAVIMRDYGVDRTNHRDKNNEIRTEIDIKIQGYGATMNNLSGSIGSRQMTLLPQILDKQARNGAAWDAFFLHHASAIPLHSSRAIKPNYWVYSALASNRDELLLKFREHGLYASKLHVRNDSYTVFGGVFGGLVGVDSFSESILCLPSGWWFNLEDKNLDL